MRRWSRERFWTQKIKEKLQLNKDLGVCGSMWKRDGVNGVESSRAGRQQCWRGWRNS